MVTNRQVHAILINSLNAWPTRGLVDITTVAPFATPTTERYKVLEDAFIGT
jgi:hypothetical protein